MSKATTQAGADGKTAQPEPTGVELAYELGRQQFVAENHETLCERSGGRLLVGKGISVPLLGKEKIVTFSDGLVVEEGGESEPPRTACLVVQYLLGADGRPLEGKDVDFRALPGGFLYYGPFSGRTTGRLVREFGHDPERLCEVGQSLGARSIDGQGDVAIEVSVLPRVPLKVVIWRGDEEFKASATVLFDSSVTGYLDTEGAAVAAEVLVTELVRRGREIEVKLR